VRVSALSIWVSIHPSSTVIEKGVITPERDRRRLGVETATDYLQRYPDDLVSFPDITGNFPARQNEFPIPNLRDFRKQRWYLLLLLPASARNQAPKLKISL
jgi:hypothetical protein